MKQKQLPGVRLHDAVKMVENDIDTRSIICRHTSFMLADTWEYIIFILHYSSIVPQR